MDVVQPNAFPSLAALRAAHNVLLLAHRERGNDPTFSGEILTFLQQGQATGAVLDSEDERKIAQSLLDYWTATLLSAGQQPPDALLADFDPSLAPLLADELCPYVGLDAFGEQKSGVFFGRQRLAKEMLDHLTQARLLAVVGPSGSGKSSLVLAGLVPALKNGAIASSEDTPDSSAWRYLPRLVPGSDPLGNLSRAIQPGKNDLATLDVGLAAKLAFAAEGFRRESNYLADLINAIYPQPVVIVVDQFEEIFTLGSDAAVRQAFIDNLLNLTQAAGPRHMVILTMRTDFESFIARLSNFQSAFEQALVRVTPLNAAELREAIEKPAAMIGLKFEDGLVDALLQDILGEPAALPLLQFTLLRLWESRDHNRITWAAYKRLGGGRLALANSADELYNALIPEEQLTVRRIFMRLVRPGEGLEITSNRVRRATLYQTGEAHDRVDRVLQKLINAHLLRVSEGDSAADTQIEVAHEALVRNWPRLVQWLEEERETIRERLRLTAAAEQWSKLGRDPSALLRGALLEEAQRRPDLNELEKEFVQASQEALAAVIRAQEAARQHELEQAHALAEEQRQRAETERQWGEFQASAATRLRQRNFWLSGLSAAAALLALTAVWFAFTANQHAQEAALERATAIAASTQAVQQADAADFARADALIVAATANALANNASQNEQRVQYALGALQAIINELQKSPRLTPTPTAIPNAPIPSSDSPEGQATLPTSPPAFVVSPQEPFTATALLTATEEITPVSAAALLITATSELTAIIPNITLDLYQGPSNDASVIGQLREPMRVAVLQATSEWANVVAPDGQVGWITAWKVTYEGDPARLPVELRSLVVSNQEDVPYTYGQVISFGEATGDYLLNNPGDEKSGQVWVPVGTKVILLFTSQGAASYGSSTWYFVVLNSDPTGQNILWRGYLPAEVIGPETKAQ